MTITGPDGTMPERLDYLRSTHSRLRRFLNRAESLGWTIEPSGVAKDTIIVRRPRHGDHFVLYPSGEGRRASLSVYDARDGYEFSPLPTRDAMAFIAANGERAGV